VSFLMKKSFSKKKRKKQITLAMLSINLVELTSFFCITYHCLTHFLALFSSSLFSNQHLANKNSLHKKKSKLKFKEAIEHLINEHADVIKSIREEHRRSMNRLHRKKEEAIKKSKASTSGAIEITSSNARRWSSEQKR